MKCTWKGCEDEGEHSLLDRNGEEWAKLCSVHNNKFEAGLEEMGPKTLLRVWALAGHGHPKREREKEAFVKTAGNLFEALQKMRKQ